MRFGSRGKHNRSRRGHVIAYRTVRGARATLVVTRSEHDRVKSEVKIYASVNLVFIRLDQKYYEYFRREYYCK